MYIFYLSFNLHTIVLVYIMYIIPIKFDKNNTHQCFFTPAISSIGLLIIQYSANICTLLVKIATYLYIFYVPVSIYSPQKTTYIKFKKLMHNHNQFFSSANNQVAAPLMYDCNAFKTLVKGLLEKFRVFGSVSYFNGRI